MKRNFQLFIQTLIINVTISLSALGYTLMQYVELPKQAVAVSHVLWIIGLLFVLCFQVELEVNVLSRKWIDSI